MPESRCNMRRAGQLGEAVARSESRCRKTLCGLTVQGGIVMGAVIILTVTLSRAPAGSDIMPFIFTTKPICASASSGGFT